MERMKRINIAKTNIDASTLFNSSKVIKLIKWYLEDEIKLQLYLKESDFEFLGCTYIDDKNVEYYLNIKPYNIIINIVLDYSLNCIYYISINKNIYSFTTIKQ